MDIQTQEVLIVPIIIGVVQALKIAGLPSKYAAIVSLVLGILSGLVLQSGMGLASVILMGIFYGLSAAGLYSGVKKLAN